jgi:Fe-S cluster assembly protein SufD
MHGNDMHSYVTMQARSRPGNPVPAWLKQRRRDGLALLTTTGFPTTRHEEWKYTNVAPLTQIQFRAAEGPTHDATATETAQKQALEDCLTLFFLNGRYKGPLHDTTDLPPGLTVLGLDEAVRRNEAGLEQYLGKIANARDNSFTALNTALIDDGAFIAASADTRYERPIQLLYVHMGTDKPSAVHVRNVIVAAPHSALSVIETHVYLGETPGLTTAVTEIACDHDARVEHYKVQHGGPGAYHIGSVQSSQARNSQVHSYAASFGGALTRNDINASLAAEGAECSLRGLFIASGQQHVDYHTTIDHAAPHGTSSQLYKAVLDCNGTGVFNGKVIVRPHAQKTSAEQSSKNLLLSDSATINAKPQLEIFADDVRCTHGATVGHVDEEALFYLRSRGIDETVARGLLIHAFADELVQQVRIPALASWLDDAVCSQLPGGASVRSLT